MAFKLVSIDNKNSVGNEFIGKTADFRYDGRVFYFSSLYSSLVQDIERNDITLTVTTRNSVYVFEDV